MPPPGAWTGADQTRNAAAQVAPAAHSRAARAAADSDAAGSGRGKRGEAPPGLRHKVLRLPLAERRALMALGSAVGGAEDEAVRSRVARDNLAKIQVRARRFVPPLPPSRPQGGRFIQAGSQAGLASPLWRLPLLPKTPPEEPRLNSRRARPLACRRRTPSLPRWSPTRCWSRRARAGRWSPRLGRSLLTCQSCPAWRATASSTRGAPWSLSLSLRQQRTMAPAPAGRAVCPACGLLARSRKSRPPRLTDAHGRLPWRRARVGVEKVLRSELAQLLRTHVEAAVQYRERYQRYRQREEQRMLGEHSRRAPPPPSPGYAARVHKARLPVRGWGCSPVEPQPWCPPTPSLPISPPVQPRRAARPWSPPSSSRRARWGARCRAAAAALGAAASTCDLIMRRRLQSPRSSPWIWLST